MPMTLAEWKEMYQAVSDQAHRADKLCVKLLGELNAAGDPSSPGWQRTVLHIEQMRANQESLRDTLHRLVEMRDRNEDRIRMSRQEELLRTTARATWAAAAAAAAAAFPAFWSVVKDVVGWMR
jgi:hypothetical protein